MYQLHDTNHENQDVIWLLRRLSTHELRLLILAIG